MSSKWDFKEKKHDRLIERFQNILSIYQSLIERSVRIGEQYLRK